MLLADEASNFSAGLDQSSLGYQESSNKKSHCFDKSEAERRVSVREGVNVKGVDKLHKIFCASVVS
jgi:hypothetical protein